ncbi:uncharacterized protein LOC103172541 [Callorhinchus milii]|uniref:uncharacterized protein LOC103172541 n=1 Tax=Callorhinchus milii TaxID=7868 RepID=UPI001C3FA0E5|nr:uncharacterized protein LOC103172541 [Callorhinchus milii]
MKNANVSHTDVHWYRQLPGQHKEWILTHDTNGRKTDHEDVNQRLQPSRVTSNNTYILILRRVTVSDAAVYHCCVWGDVCGNGTRLKVTSVAAPLLIQSPTLERVTEGHPARLQCSMKNADVSHSDVHWYRQLPGQQREWILTHDTNGRKTDHEVVNQRLQPSRVTSNNTYILILRRVTVSDAAVYQCCVEGDVCGNGTRLNITRSREQVWINMGTALGVLACVAAAFLTYKMCSL